MESIGPDSLVEHRQLLRRLETALADLPHQLRVVFVLCAVEEVPGKEAAHVLGIREGTLWRRLHEARTALREAVEAT
jgi:RNA polymerase sigma-70 factor (ECF subfamily)